MDNGTALCAGADDGGGRLRWHVIVDFAGLSVMEDSTCGLQMLRGVIQQWAVCLPMGPVNYVYYSIVR